MMEGAMRLTTATIRSLSLPAGKGEAIYFDDDLPGFGLRIREGGSRTFVFQYKIGSKQRRMALGSVKAIDVGKARETAKDLHAAVRLGGDPAGDRAEGRAQVAETFEAALRPFLARQKARLRPKSYVELERHLFVAAKPLHRLQLSKIDRRAVAALLAEVATDRGPPTANRVRSAISSFFASMIRDGIADSNPVTGTSTQKERPRDRVLSPEELRTIWNALPDDHYGAILKLLALTAQRAGEIAGLRWSEVDLDRGMILLAGARTKNGRPHSVPLSQAARAIIAAMPRRFGRDLIFGMGEGPYSNWSAAKLRLDEKIPLPNWTPHDLRRTAATMMAEIGIEPHIIEAILNHISGHKGGVAGRYNWAVYEHPKRAALDRWAEHLTAIIEGRESNVTPLKRA
jgi:integrase